MRRVSAWLVMVPLMLAGTEVAHSIAYRIVYPQAEIRWQVLAATGHGYMGLAPLFLAIGGALCAIGLLRSALDTARRRAPRPVPPWMFAVLPLAGFTLQEFLERWVALGGFPWWMVEQPTFRVGLLLQLPFAFLAFLTARLLLRVAKHVGISLRAPGRTLVLLGGHRPPASLTVFLPRRSALAGCQAQRGPPAVRVALP